MNGLRVAVLRGGPAPHYETSLENGQEILRNLPEGFRGLDILVTKDGTWHLEGMPIKPERITRESDVVFSTLPSKSGERYHHKVFEHYGHPFIGPRTFSTAIWDNKLLFKNYLRRHGFSVPHATTVSATDYDPLRRAFWSVSGPWVIRLTSGGGEHRTLLAKNLNDLKLAMDIALEHADEILIEEYILGKEVSVFLIENFRGEKHYFLPPVEISRSGDLGSPTHIVPGRFTDEEKRILQQNAIGVFKAIGGSFWGQVDMLVHPSGRIYVLDVNLVPALHSKSPFREALNSVGAKFSDFVGHVLELASFRKS